jgi:hypothetical protein
VAWAADTVAGVEVSLDGGRSWSEANLIGPRAAYSWTMWEFLWEVAEPGDYTLLARATSAGGQVQPVRHDPLNGGYQIHFSRPRTVRVERSRHIVDQPTTAETMQYDMNAFAEDNMRFPLDVALEFGGGEGI